MLLNYNGYYYKKINNKIWARSIKNIGTLRDVLLNLATEKEFFNVKGKVAVDDLVNASNKLYNKIEIDKTKLDYSNIEDNLKESERLLNEIHNIFEKTKGNNIKMDVQIKDIQIKSNDINIENLNNQNKTNQIMNEIKTKDDNLLKEVTDNSDVYVDKIDKVRQSLFDAGWLESFFNFMHNHSTLILTLSSGIIMGGMLYMNNIGYLNIGQLLTRLGISIFTGNQNTNQNVGNITIPSSSVVNTIESNTNNIGRTFFRQLGDKVLNLLDVLIEKLKDNRQKYK